MPKNREFNWGKWLIILVLLGGAIVGGVWYFKRDASKAPQYQTAAIARGELTQAVTATGQLKPVLNVQVGSQISGIIQKLFVDFNSPVEAGQVIAQLDPATYQANVLQAEGELANAKAAMELAQLNARRAEELFRNNLIAQAEHDQAMIARHQAEAQVKIRQASLERAKVDLARCTIYAPVDGVVISRDVDVGQTVAASLQAPTLFLIANDLTKMHINANVAEADIGGVEVGQDVEFTVDAFPYRTFTGKVVQVRNAPITVQNVVTYDTVVEVSNPDLKLKPGMTANVSIIIAQRENTLRIPNSALRVRLPEEVTGETRTNAPAMTVAAQTQRSAPGGERGGRGGGGARQGGSGPRLRVERQAARTVYVLSGAGENAKPTPVQIKTGITDGIATEVLEGLNEGDVVITGLMVADSPTAPGRTPTQSPFGGGSFRRL